MVSIEHRTAIKMDSVAFAWPGRDPFRLSIPGFTLESGSKTILLGASGSGKSTLLSLICGIIRPNAGSVCVNGTDLATLAGGARDKFRAETIGVIFQMFNLLPYASPLDNILLPLQFAKNRRSRIHGAPKDAAFALAAALGLENPLLTAGPSSQLSVGQQQRVAVARALIGAPPLVIADEPTSALDAATQGAFLDLLFEQVGAAGSSLLMVSHDERLVDRFDRVVEIADIAMMARGSID